MPKLIFPLTMLEKPKKEIIKVIRDAMFNFLWDGKPDKINRNIIIQDYSEGGLKMIEIDSYINSLKAKWIKRILDEENKGLWKEIYIKELKKVGNILIFKSNIKHTDVLKLKIKSKFLSEIVESWTKINFTEIEMTSDKNIVSEQIIWNNSYITSNRNLFFYKDWYEKGVLNIKHLYDYRIKSFLSFDDFKNIFNIKNSF